MVRNRTRKTDIGLHSEKQIKEAIDLIYERGKIREISKLKNIPYTTLYRYYKKTLNNEGNITFTPNYKNRQIFSSDQEKILLDYIVQCSQMFYGLTPVDVRKLAYEMACANGITVPQKWHETQLAGVEWFYCFRKRHKMLSLRTPEGCSLSRATSFNRHNVNIYFDLLQKVMQREPNFGNGTRVYNLDETSTMTVQKSGKVVAVRGQKQVCKVTSAERGSLVTTCYIVNALNQALPPVMIFPRVHFKQHMITGAPTGTLGLATPSGWMNSELFVKTMEHFIKNTQSSKKNPSLLIMDNFEAHICLEAINLAKDNGVTILTVPPHSTMKLQPLDVAIYKPFKVAYNAAVDSWLMRNPGRTLSIYEVAQCVNEAHMISMTPANICKAFACTGIYPYNRNIFTDVDFAPSEVTNREIEPGSSHSAGNPIGSVPDESFAIDNRIIDISPHVQSGPLETSRRSHSSSPSILIPQNLLFGTTTPSEDQAETLRSQTKTPPFTDGPTTSKDFLSPFELRGLPKAGARKGGRAPRRKGKTMIATDTPNKLEIEERLKEKQRKKDAKAKKRKVFQAESSEEECDKISVYSEEEPSSEDENEDDQFLITENFKPLYRQPKEGDFILVQFNTKKRVFYLAKVIGEGSGSDVVVSYLRKSSKIENAFQLPNVPDIATVLIEDVIMIMPKPIFSGGTKRQQGLYKFNINFYKLDIR